MAIHVGVYWGPRKEDIDKCADRVLQCFRGVSAIHSVCASWFEKGRSVRAALNKSLDLGDRQTVLRLLEKGRNRGDTDHAVIERLGFRIGIWNGEKQERAVSISIHCGAFGEFVGNNVLLFLPSGVPELVASEPCAALLESLARSFEPEWGVVSSDGSRNLLQQEPGAPFVDWIFYQNRIDLELSKLPHSATFKLIDNLGTIVVVQERPIDALKEEDLANARKTATALNLKG